MMVIEKEEVRAENEERRVKKKACTCLQCVEACASELKLLDTDIGEVAIGCLAP